VLRIAKSIGVKDSGESKLRSRSVYGTNPES
jgi:hypothetical protein